MALFNNNNKKRKSSSDIIFEVNEDDCSTSSSPEPVVNKIELKSEIINDINNSNLNDSTQINKETLNEKTVENVTNIKLLPKILEGSVNDQVNKTETSQTSGKTYLFSINFFDENFARKHKLKLLKNIMDLFDYELMYETNENNLEVKFREEKVSSDMDIVDEDSNNYFECEDINLDNLFTVDTTPNAKMNLNSTPRFLPRFEPIEEKIKNDSINKNDTKAMPQICFNCNGNHVLRDCKEPKDHRRIQMARTTRNSKLIRYHLDEEQKYSHILPGKISNKLREALELKENDIPNYIYHMRRFGYPPGWLQMAKVTSSNIALIDFHGSSVTNKEDQETIDISKIIEYPGFNTYVSGLKDDYKKYGCPPFSKEHSKENMIAFIQKFQMQVINTKNNSNNTVKKDKEFNKSIMVDTVAEIAKNNVKSRETSPTLNELELKKKQLLDMLKSSEPEQTGTPKTPNTDSANSLEVKTNFVKSSTFGTPILKTNSPFEKLPSPENFSKDISQVINFENLPNATGKYEQMNQVISKVRKTIKYGNESK